MPTKSLRSLKRDDHTVVTWSELAKLRQADFELTILKLAIKKVAQTNPSVYATIKAAKDQIDGELPF